ncbi:MAG: hypothetical protein JW909_07290 [Planctomycetes bacterium]|nr:hypothetical protein [Planctomycetota bacterium]
MRARISITVLIMAASLGAAGCRSIYQEKAHVLEVEWACDGALIVEEARGVRLASGSIIGNEADASWLGVVVGLGRESGENIVSAGVHAELGLEMLTLLGGREAPGWSRYVSPVLGAGAGAFYGEGSETGFGGYCEAEIGAAVRLGDGLLFRCGYRGSLYAARRCGAAHGPAFRLDFTF